METKPIHPTIATQFCDSLVRGHLSGSYIDGSWAADIPDPELLTDGAYILCACCFKVLLNWHGPPTYIAHECHESSSARATGRNLAGNLLRIQDTIQRTVQDGFMALRSRDSLAKALSGAGNRMTQDAFADIKATIKKARSGKVAKVMSLDRICGGINCDRALTFYGKDLADHPLTTGATSFRTELEELTGEKLARVQRAADDDPTDVIVQTDAMPIPVLYRPSMEMIEPVVSKSARAILSHAMLNHSCTKLSTACKQRAYGRSGLNLAHLSLSCANKSSATRCLKGCTPELFVPVDED
ncbi:putative major outer capsid protein [Etheostoma fonticola aquareovirus]|uniref:putative major outer capsid protein n=1 Tax=Etheostoma fonticola aquareovirus TaxID=1862978 RepID=UPI0007F1789D|nr:putative major outer capsid protein [Etheostoma fonticola aquareovirus]ANN11956.1 putative major outer capsid protein [Etheostoma fonticola aquareovirus]